MILRRSFLKLLALPVVAPLVALFPKREVDASDWFVIDTSRVGSFEAENVFPEEMEKRIEPRYKVRQFGDFWMVPDDKETIDFLLNR